MTTLRAQSRSLTIKQHRGKHVKRPDFPLEEAMRWFLADHASDVEASTIRRYRSNLRLFKDSLPPTGRVLSSLTPESVDSWSRATSRTHHTRLNRVVALKAFAGYLARQRLWYQGETQTPLSVLASLSTPQPLKKGTPGYMDEEVRAIVRAIPRTAHYLRSQAIIAVELHGFRAKEVRTMLLRNVVLPERGELMGHFVVDERRRTKTFDGVRVVPMEPYGKDTVLRYVRQERPQYTGTDAEEPLFLTEDGRAFTEGGWNAMAKRIRNALAAEHITFRQHRFRSTRVQQLHAAGVPDSVIVETMGWGKESGDRMLHRYVGRIPLSTLKRSTPVLLDRVVGRAV